MLTQRCTDLDADMYKHSHSCTHILTQPTACTRPHDMHTLTSTQLRVHVHTACTRLHNCTPCTQHAHAYTAARPVQGAHVHSHMAPRHTRALVPVFAPGLGGTQGPGGERTPLWEELPSSSRWRREAGRGRRSSPQETDSSGRLFGLAGGWGCRLVNFVITAPFNSFDLDDSNL